MKKHLKLIIFNLLICLLFAACNTNPDADKPPMVILIGIDGMSIPGMQRAHTPVMDELIANGAVSLKTRSVMPTVSAPNWASHMMGAGPEQHAVTFNGWTTENTLIEPAETDEKGYFPSIFSVIKKQKPDALTCFFYDWDELDYLVNPQFIDKNVYSKTLAESLQKATPWIVENRPLFSFIYVGHPDEVGHEHKWESPEFIKSLEEVDSLLGGFMNTLKQQGLYGNIVFLVVSDHGGIDYSHGGISMQEIQVPWIISGPGIIKNKVLEQPNNIPNTASTILHVLGLQQPLSWVGSPAFGAFSNHPLSKENNRQYVPQPHLNINSGIYDVTQKLSMNVSWPGVDIYYTLDGSVPDLESLRFENVIELDASCVVKAAAFKEGHWSQITSIEFQRVKRINKAEVVPAASDKYAASGAFTLVDRKRGSGDFKDGRWLGYQSVNVEALLIFEKTEEINRIEIGYLSNPSSWIFAPQSIFVYGSENGRDFFELGSADNAMIAAQEKKGRNAYVFSINPVRVKYLRVKAKNTGLCPEGHPGAGQPAWLFLDEILVK